MTQSPAEPKLYSTTGQGLAAFIWYVNCNEDAFVRVDIQPQGRPVLVLRDDLRGNPCKELETLYHDGVQLRNVREYALCYRQLTNEIRAAFKKSNKSY
jgi:hypothetical protein